MTKNTRFAFFFLLFSLFMCSSEALSGNVHELAGRASARKIFSRKDGWVEDALRKMTLQEKVGQMIIASIEGHYSGPDDKAFQLMTRLVREGKVGGIMFLKGDVTGAALLANHFQMQANWPLLISADMERGVAMRLQGATEFPPSMALAATRNSELAFEMANVVAKESSALGIHQNYAPSVDLNINPANPVINTRSFGDNIPLTISMSAAIIDGLQSNGVIATAKHFPGHGDVTIDSHHALPVLEADRTRLMEYELKPFKAAIDQGVMCVMIGHLAVPKLTGTLEPATISKTIVTDLLRTELGFKGLIITDALNMKALYNGNNVEEISVKAIQAGNDLLLFPADPELTYTAVVAAVQNGQIPVEQINSSVRRILQAKRWLGLDKKRLVDIPGIGELVSQPSSIRLSEIISENAVTVVRQSDGVLPLKVAPEQRVLNIIVQDKPESPRGAVFSENLKAAFASDTVQLDNSSLAPAYRNAEKLASQASTVILTVYGRALSVPASTKPGERLQQFIHSLSVKLSASKPLILVSFGSPYLIDGFPEIPTVICAYSSSNASESAVVKLLNGSMKADGRLPVSLKAATP